MSNTCIVVGCSAKKKSYRCTAEEMYSESTLFSKEVAYIKSYYTTPYYILSAKYGIIRPSKMIDPYNFSMKDAKKVPEFYQELIIIIRLALVRYDKIIIFAGIDYIRAISIACPLSVIIAPMEGMGIGKRLQFLKVRCC